MGEAGVAQRLRNKLVIWVGVIACTSFLPSWARALPIDDSNTHWQREGDVSFPQLLKVMTSADGLWSARSSDAWLLFGFSSAEACNAEHRNSLETRREQLTVSSFLHGSVLTNFAGKNSIDLVRQSSVREVALHIIPEAKMIMFLGFGFVCVGLRYQRRRR